MSLKTIFVGAFFDSSIEEHRPSESLIRYAIDMAISQGAHLSIGVGLAKLSAPSVVLKEVRGIIAAANRERLHHAETFAEDMVARTRASGVVGDVAAMQDDFNILAKRFIEKTRLTDLAILEPSNELLSLKQALVERVLFESGRPVIIAPRGWAGSAAPERIMVSWDGGARSARAIGEALPLLQQAKMVDIVSVSGDPDSTKRYDGADIAHHLARHCRGVQVEQLTSLDGDIAAVLGNYAKETSANLLVMGAYGHSRIAQFVLGGVTQSMIFDPPIPVFMSY